MSTLLRKPSAGIAVYIAENLNSERVEALWFEKFERMLFGAVYRLPNLDATVRKKCLIDKQTKVTVLLGDFNLDHIPPNVATKHFQRITNLYNLRQLIIEPTRITHHSKTLIELFFTSKPEFYVSGVSPIGFYHQLAIFGTRKRHKISLRHSFLSKIYS